MKSKNISQAFDRPFKLEAFFAEWEFTARYNLCGTDMQSMRMDELLALAEPADREAFEKLYLGYTETWGHPALREALSVTFERQATENVLCFAGSEESIFCIMHALMEKDDHAIVVGPCYQSAETVPGWIGDVTVAPLDENANWALDLDRVKAALRDNTKLIYVNFPNNPTGKLLTHDELNGLVQIARERGVHIVSDEIFRGSERDPETRMEQVADIYERGVSLSGMSKTYGLAGLRIGWAVSPDTELLQRAERIKHFLTICSSGPSEMLSIIAINARDEIFSRNNRLAKEYLAQLEAFLANHEDLFEWRTPEGGTFGYAKYLGPGDVETFTNKLVRETGVLLAPASLFASDFENLPADRFRIGFNRSFIKEALGAFDAYLR